VLLPFSALRVRNFRLFFVGQIASNVGTWFQSLAQVLLVIELTGSGKALGLVTALQFAPALVLGPYAGTLVDRLPTRKSLLVTSLLSALLAGSLAAVAALHGLHVLWVYAIALGLGCVQAFDRPASQAFVYELAGPDELQKAIGLHSITQSSARMLGPALAGAAYPLLGGAGCFAINAASFLCVTAALLAMRSDRLWQRKSAGDAGRGSIMEGVRYAMQRPELRAPLLVNALVGCLTFNFMTTITAMVRFDLHGDASSVGAAHALNAVGAVLGSLIVVSGGRVPSRAMLALACGGMAFAIAVNAAVPNVLAFLIWAPVFGLSVGAYQTNMLSAVQRNTEPAMLGRMSSLLTLGTTGMAPIASLVAGWLIDAWSARAAMGLGAAASLIGALLLARPLHSRGPAPQVET